MVTTHLRFEAVTLPPGSLAVFDPKSRTLVVRTTNATHEQIDSLAMEAQGGLSKFLNFSVYLLEADAGVVREVVSQCATLADHTPALARVEDLAARGQARQLGTLRLNTISGQRAQLSRATNYSYPAEFQFDERDQMEFIRATRAVGTQFEIEPTLQPDGMTVDVVYSLEHHFAAPTQRYEYAGQRGKRTVEARVTDFHRARVTSTNTLLAGTTKLLGVWNPEDQPATAGANAAAAAPPPAVPAPPAAERTQLAFLKCDVVHLLPNEDKRASDILREHGEKVLPTPKTPPPSTAGLPAGMILRRFQVTMEAISAKASSGASEVPADPFAAKAPSMASEPTIRARVTVLDVLRAQGIPFPQGSSANYNSATSELIIRNAPANMALAEAWLATLKRDAPKTIVTTLHIVQANAATIRKMEAESAIYADNTSAFKSLEAEAAAGRAKILRTAWLETRNAQRVSMETGHERMHVTAVAVRCGPDFRTTTPSEAKEGDSKQPLGTSVRVSSASGHAISPVINMENDGLRLEIDPVIRTDGETVHLGYSLAYDFAAPVLRQDPPDVGDVIVRMGSSMTDFHRAEQSSSITLLSGTMRLLGVWKPTTTTTSPDGQDNSDVLQAAFLRAEVVSTEPDEVR